MRKIAFLLLAWLLTGLQPAEAQQANFNYLGNQFSVVPTPPNTSVTSSTQITNGFANAVTGQTGRQSCWIQYRPATGIPVNSVTNQGFVFFGATAPATLSSSFVLQAFGILTCEQANEAEGGGVWVSGAATGDSFIIKVK